MSLEGERDDEELALYRFGATSELCWGCHPRTRAREAGASESLTVGDRTGGRAVRRLGYVGGSISREAT
jgi:hypothetical protein